MDLFPTFAGCAKVGRLPERIEGGSIDGLLTDEGAGEVSRPKEELVFHFPHYQGAAGPRSAIRIGSLKLVKTYEDDTVALHDLSKDIGEQIDLSHLNPAKTAELRKRLEKYLEDVGARMPKPNPQYDPSRRPTPRRRGRGSDRGR